MRCPDCGKFVSMDNRDQVPQAEMAEFFNVGVTTINAIHTARNWAFLR